MLSLLGTLLAAIATVPAGGYDFPAREWPNLIARLRVQVADEPDAAGFARVRLTVDVQGPATLEVTPVLLGDATDAWKVERVSAWRVVGGKGRWEETLDLRQVKSGVVPIPSVKIRCRESADAEWRDAEWTDILTDVHPLRPPPPPPPPPRFGLQWLWFVVAAVAVLGVAGLVWWRMSKRPPPHVPTHEERALAALARLEATLSQPSADARAFTESLSLLLRRYVAERFALPAPRQTTPEFLETVRAATTVSDAQREQLRAVLERCDLVKFAGALPDAEESRSLAAVVRTFIQTPSTVPNNVRVK